MKPKITVADTSPCSARHPSSGRCFNRPEHGAPCRDLMNLSRRKTSMAEAPYFRSCNIVFFSQTTFRNRLKLGDCPGVLPGYTHSQSGRYPRRIVRAPASLPQRTQRHKKIGISLDYSVCYSSAFHITHGWRHNLHPKKRREPAKFLFQVIFAEIGP